MRDEKYQVLRKKIDAYEEYLDTVELLELLKERTDGEEKDNLRLKRGGVDVLCISRNTRHLTETAKASIERLFKEVIMMVNEEADYELEKIVEAKEAL